MLVCPNCFNHAFVQLHIRENGSPGDCDICGATETTVIDAHQLHDLFAPLFELYEPAEQGTHYAVDPVDGDLMAGDQGEPLEDAIQEWGIFSERIGRTELSRLLDELWPGYDPTATYATHDLWYVPSGQAFQWLADRLIHERRWFPVPRDPEDDVRIDDLLGGHLEHFAISGPAEMWYRARKHPRDIGADRPVPFTNSEMGCPPTQLRSKGQRANPAGIAYLYLASREHTAIAEVRAVAGDYVSVGQFEVPANLKIIDLARNLATLDPFKYGDLRLELERRSLLEEFGRWLSKPVRDEDHEVDYVVTQYLAEYILHKGYDGIMFESSVDDGKNLVLFNPNVTKCIGTALVHVNYVKTEYRLRRFRPPVAANPPERT